MTSRSVVSTLPTSTTNMTGFFAIVRGCSLRSESHDRAAATICGSQMEFDLCVCVIRTPVRAFIRKCSTIGPRLSAGKNGQRADDHDHADEQRREERRRHRERPERRRNALLAARGCRRSRAAG